MGGPRQLLILYIPLILTDGILLLTINITKTRSETTCIKRFAAASFLSSVCSVIGYLINSKILSEIYYFKVWKNIRYQNISIQSFMNVVNGILSFFGFKTNDVFSFASISNLFCGILLILLIFIIYHGIKDRESSDELYVCSVYFLVSIIVFAMLYTVTNMTYSDRYNVPVLIFALPLFVIGIKELGWFKRYKKTLSIVLVLGMILCCGKNYLNYLNGNAYASSDSGSEYISIANVLVDGGYTEGYATFWDGNILTELSDGEIDVRVWEDSSAQTIDQIYKWLQLKKHADTVPEGSVFVLLRPSQYDKIAFYPLLNEENIIYKTDNHVIYGYENYDSLLSDLEDDIEDEE